MIRRRQLVQAGVWQPSWWTATYLGRYVSWGPSADMGYSQFPSRRIGTGPAVFTFDKSLDNKPLPDRVNPVQYTSGGTPRSARLETLLAESGTSAFIVIRDGMILYEAYFQGHNRASLHPSASVAKSFVSALVGIAINHGLIGRVDDPIGKYLPELADDRAGSIAIRQLLTMSSGLKHTWGLTPGKDLVRSTYAPDLRSLALRVRVMEEPDLHFNYSNYHTQLLGMILERVTGMSASNYLESQLWMPLGMEYAATWCLDSEKTGFELMAGGINASAIDYAKLGMLYLNLGEWGGRQVAPRQWVAASTRRWHARDQAPGYYPVDHPLFAGGLRNGGYYGHHWWGREFADGGYEYYALGYTGQFIYVHPQNRVVIVRMGNKWGDVDWWPDLFDQLVERLGPRADA